MISILYFVLVLSARPAGNGRERGMAWWVFPAFILISTSKSGCVGSKEIEMFSHQCSFTSITCVIEMGLMLGMYRCSIANARLMDMMFVQ